LDFDAVVAIERQDTLPIGIFGFSYGALVAIEYTLQHILSPKAMVFFSPALDFVRGVFENTSSVMGTLYQEAETNGSLERDGYFVLPYNGFKVGKKVFESAGKYKPYENLPKIAAHTLIIQGKNDQILSYEYMKQLGEPIVEKYVVLDTVH
jgi:alpha-beta hydrolase superfamily lysophospholipase